MRLALFQPDIPQNLGAAIRLAACLGVHLEVIEPCGFPLSAKELKRTAMDYSDKIVVERRKSWTEFVNAPERKEGRLILFTTRGAIPCLGLLTLDEYLAELDGLAISSALRQL